MWDISGKKDISCIFYYYESLPPCRRLKSRYPTCARQTFMGGDASARRVHAGLL